MGNKLPGGLGNKLAGAMTMIPVGRPPTTVCSPHSPASPWFARAPPPEAPGNRLVKIL